MIINGKVIGKNTISCPEQLESMISEYQASILRVKTLFAFLMHFDRMDSDDKETQDLINLLKFNCFLASSTMDLFCVLKGFYYAKTNWEHIFLAKNGYHIIFETIKTYNTTFGTIKKIVENRHPELLPQIKKIKNTLKEYKAYNVNVNEEKLRNYVTGHYHHDYLTYDAILGTINSEKAIIKFELFITFITEVLVLLADLPAKMQEKKGKPTSTAALEFIKYMDNFIADNNFL